MNKQASITINGIDYDYEKLVNFTQSTFPGENIISEFLELKNTIGEWFDEKDHLIVSTSGSTGKPTKVSLKKEHLAASAKQTGEFLGLKEKDHALLCLPLNFIAGKMMVIRAIVLGLDLCPVSPSGNPLKNTNKKFTFAALTPMQFANTLQSPDGMQKLNNIDSLILGGAEIPGKLLPQIKQLDNKIWHTYGMTETITHVAMKRLNGPNPDKCFNALPGVMFARDQRGCLIIDAPKRGVRNLVTNDCIDLISETEFVFLGRHDFVINSGGVKLSPEAIEGKLSAYLKQNFIIGFKKDIVLGQKLVLVCEGKQNNSFDFLSITQRSGLSKYETPKEVIFIERFPTTSSGKIDRRKILQTLSGTI